MNSTRPEEQRRATNNGGVDGNAALRGANNGSSAATHRVAWSARRRARKLGNRMRKEQQRLAGNERHDRIGMSGASNRSARSGVYAAPASALHRRGLHRQGGLATTPAWRTVCAGLAMIASCFRWQCRLCWHLPSWRSSLDFPLYAVNTASFSGQVAGFFVQALG